MNGLGLSLGISVPPIVILDISGKFSGPSGRNPSYGLISVPYPIPPSQIKLKAEDSDTGRALPTHFKAIYSSGVEGFQ